MILCYNRDNDSGQVLWMRACCFSGGTVMIFDTHAHYDDVQFDDDMRAAFYRL